MPGRYEVEYVVQFSETGLSELVQDFRSKLEALSRSTGSLPYRQEGLTSLRESAEEQIQRGLGTGELTKASAAKIRAELTRTLNQALESAASGLRNVVIASPAEVRRAVEQRRSPAARAAQEAPRGLSARAAQTAADLAGFGEELTLEEQAQVRAEATIKQRQLSALTDEILATSRDYNRALADATVAANRLRSAEADALSRADVIRSGVVADTDENVLASLEAEARATTVDYITSTTLVAEQRNRLAAAEAEGRRRSEDYLGSVARLARETDLLAAAETRARTATANIAAATERRLARERLATRENIAFLQARTPGDLRDSGYEAFLKRQQTTQIQLASETFAAESNLADQTGRLAAIRARRVAQEQNAALRATTDADDRLAARNELLRSDQRARRILAQQAELDRPGVRDAYNRTQAEAAVAKARQAAEIRAATEEEKARSQAYIAATARANRARAEQALQIKAEELGLRRGRGEGVDRAETADQFRSRVLNQDRVQKLRERNDIQQRLLNNEAGALDEVIRERRLQEQLNAKLREELGQAGGRRGFFASIRRQGPDDQRGLFQRVHSFTRAQDTSEGQNFRQFIASRTITAAGFAVAGGGLYGALSLVTRTIREAEELERVLNQVEAQFDAIGEGDQFAGFRNGLLDISKQTGTAADQVAFVGFQMKGAFGDTPAALKATSDAMRAVKVTGLELNEVVDSLTAVSLTYNVSIGEISDTTLGLQERFGVLAKETIPFVADLAAVGEEAGLSFKELAALGAAAQQVSGRSGTALAEAFGRIIPAMKDTSVEIVGLYRRLPALASSMDRVTQAAGQGDTGQILIQLARDWDKLGKAEQDWLITRLGGRREAAALIPLLENSTRLIEELERTESDAGKTTDYFNKLQETLTQTLARLREELTQLGEALFRAGLADILRDVATAGHLLLSVLSPIARVLADVNEMMGGNLARFAEALVAVSLLTKGYNAMKVAALGAAGAQVAAGAAGGAAGAGGAVAAGAAGGMLSRLLLSPATVLGAAYGRATAARAATAGATGLAARMAAPGAIGMAALGLGPVGLMVGAGVAVGLAYYAQKAKLDKQEKELIEKFREADRAKLLEISKTKSDFWTRVGAAVFDLGPLPEVRAQALLDLQIPDNARAAEDFKVAVEKKIISDRDIVEIQQRFPRKKGDLDLDSNLIPGFRVKYQSAEALVRAMSEGEEDALKVVRALLAEDNLSAADRLALANALKERDDKLKVEANRASVDSGSVLEGVSETERLYQAGQRSLGQLIVAYDSAIRDYEAVSAIGGLQPEQREKLADLRLKRAKLAAESLAAEADQAGSMAEVLGFGGPEDRVGRLNALLANAAYASPEARQKTAQDLVDAMKAVRDHRINMADTAEEQLKILMEGFTLENPLRAQLLQSLAAVDVAWQLFLEHFVRSITDPVAFATEVARLAVELGITHAQAAVLVLERGLAEFDAYVAANQRYLDPAELAALRQERARWTSALAAARGRADAGAGPAVPDTQAEPTPEEVKAAEDKARQERHAKENARIALERTRAEGDPVAVARIERRAADAAARQARENNDAAAEIDAAAQRIRADRSMQDALLAVFTAQRGLASAVAAAAGDQVQVAEIQLEITQQAIRAAKAKGLGEMTPEVLNLRAQEITDRAAVDNAMLEVFTAQRRLVSSVAEAAGDQVEVAKIQLELTQETIRRRIAQGYAETSPELLGLRAQANADAAALRDADLEKRLEDIDFRREMGEITKSQQIAEIESILAQADLLNLTTDSRRDLMRKIKRLREEVSKDVIGIGEIKLPTLYEIRRLKGAEASGGGYNDNRQINVVMYNQNATDYQGAINRFRDELNGGSRYGTTARLY